MDFPGAKLLLKIISFVISSYILIHVLAVFGIFLAVAYPLWWILAPKVVPCLLCRIGKNGDYCPFCRQTINKKLDIYPKSFLSTIFNGLLILAFSLVSFALVFGESKILFRLGFPPTPKTISFIIPSKGQYRLGEIFPMKIEITGIKKPINAIQADLTFDSQNLEAVEVSTTDSFATVFIQKEINNETGYVRLSGGLPNPGFFGERGIFGAVLFKGKNPGLAKVEFLPSSLVLANDGQGTNVLKELASASYLILPEEISEEEKKQQEVLLQPAVLGERTEDVQMKFYEEGKILGTQAGEEIKEAKEFNLGKESLKILEKIDYFTLLLWDRFLP